MASSPSHLGRCNGNGDGGGYGNGELHGTATKEAKHWEGRERRGRGRGRAGGWEAGPCLVQIKLGPDHVPARFPRAAALSSMWFSKQSNKIGISDVARPRGGGRG
jgi:hypothetical protein